MIQNIQYIYAGSGDSVTEMVEMQWERYDVLNFYGVVVRNNTHSCLFVVVMWWMFVQYIGFYEQFVNKERKYKKKKTQINAHEHILQMVLITSARTLT